MIALFPLPDELDRSYLGRLLRTNGLRTEAEIISLLAQWASVAEPSLQGICCIDLLGRAAHMELTQFVRSHSTLPLRRAITSYMPDLAHGNPESQSMLRLTGMRLARPAAYFCVDCVDSDQKTHGMSYWRRDHQLPGVTSCWEHRTPLRYVDDTEAFLKPPSRFEKNSHVVDEVWARSDLEHDGIQRFLAISRKLISFEKPIAVKIAREVLHERALDRGWSTHAGSSEKKLLSDQILMAFPRDWLATVVPALAEKAFGIPLNQVDGVLYLSTSASSVAPYILACCVLFDSADHAILALTNGSPVVRKRRPREPSVLIDDIELKRVYVRAKGQYKSVMSYISGNKNSNTTLTRLRVLGLPDISSQDDQSVLLSAAISFFLDKKSLAESAALAGVDLEKFENFIRQSGSNLTALLMEMKSPRRGPGTGVLRIKQRTPREVRAQYIVHNDDELCLMASSKSKV